MIKYLLKSWKEYLLENKSKGGLLPLDVVDFLITKYAKNPSGPVTLKRGYFDFNEFGKGFEETAASYLIPAKMLLVNVSDSDVAQGNARVMVLAIIHEIQHYNQHMRWDVDDSYREKFSKGNKMPHGRDIFEIDWITMTKFWNNMYSYEARPQEKDAIAFAEKHFDEALKMILDREKELKNKKKGATVKDKKNVRKV